MSTGHEKLQINLPQPLEGLAELALDLRFSWSHSADGLWQELNSDLWFLTRNPWMVLSSVSRERLKILADDEEFCDEIKRLLEREHNSLAAPRWFQETHANSSLTAPVAYFSLEFGLSEALPIYSGGLGLLAGDHLKAAHDLGIPLVGVGLLYQSGYFRQAIDRDGNQIALYPSNNIHELPITPVRDESGEDLKLELALPGRRLFVRVWQARIGLVTLYLLDTNCPSNLPTERCITSELYGGGPEQRLQQEILLGIGGWRLLRTLGIRPQICHMNEGHAAFVVLERACDYMQTHDVDFDTALAITRAGNLFTTHTPVEAGFDCYEPELIERYLKGYADCSMEGDAVCLNIPISKMLALGRRNPDDPHEVFNMAYLAVRGSRAVNGVSALHAKVSRGIFSTLFPGWTFDEVPVGHVTNGVHVPSWDSGTADHLWTKACGKDRWMGNLEKMSEQISETSDEELWELRMKNRSRLVSFVRHRFARQLNLQGVETHAATELARHQFDPNILTLGFARRFATYKRPTLLLHDEERLAAILTNAAQPVQLVVAGKAHPADWEGQAMIKRWVNFMQRADVRNHLMFLTDYDMMVAEQMVQGVDVWVNNPRRPWEASGTSGMKVLVNGGLNLSELDGWWAEAYEPDVGWAIGDGHEHDSDPAFDALEAEQIYQLLETKIVPEFYQRDTRGIPENWVSRIRNSMAKLTPQFSTNRMVREYLETYYLPLATEFDRRTAHDGEQGKLVRQWHDNLEEFWETLHIPDTQWEPSGAHFEISLPLVLGGIEADRIRVELYAEGKGDDKPQIHELTRESELVGTTNGFLYRARIPASRAVEDFTVRIIPRHDHAAIPIEAPQIRWQR